MTRIRHPLSSILTATVVQAVLEGGPAPGPLLSSVEALLPGQADRLSSEDGDIFVVKAGRRFELLATNSMGELLMATPALAGGALYVRASRHLFAVSRLEATQN